MNQLTCSCSGRHCMPPGYTFNPSDEQLVAYYLIKQIENHTFSEFVREKIKFLAHLYQHDPATLTAIYNYNPNRQRHMFFFTKSRKGNMCNRDGHWLPSSITKVVLSDSLVVGHKKKFIYESRVPQNSTDNWVLHTFHAGAPTVNTNSADDMDDEWVLCKICKKADEVYEDEDIYEDEDVYEDEAIYEDQAVYI